MLSSGTISITPSTNSVARRNNRPRVMTAPLENRARLSSPEPAASPAAASIRRPEYALRGDSVEIAGGSRKSGGRQCQCGADSILRIGNGKAPAVQLRHFLHEIQPEPGALAAAARAGQGIEALRNARQREVG